MEEKSFLQDLADKAPNRRKFLNRLSMASAGAAALAASADRAQGQMMAPTDVDILQFALNLEYLEAEFYSIAVTGRTIDQLGVGITGSGTPGPTTGGRAVSTQNNLVFTGEVAAEIGADERAHVNYLRTTLLGLNVQPIAKPAINLDALGFGFNSQLEFLQLARAFEDVGVTAYAGAAPLIQNRTILGAAARILAAEAEHVGNIRLQVARLRVPTTPLDGVDILPPPSGVRFISVDAQGLVATRTPGQVLYIVYGFQANVNGGGFFPNGVNGTLRTSSGPAPVPMAMA